MRGPTMLLQEREEPANLGATAVFISCDVLRITPGILMRNVIPDSHANDGRH